VEVPFTKDIPKTSSVPSLSGMRYINGS